MWGPRTGSIYLYIYIYIYIYTFICVRFWFGLFRIKFARVQLVADVRWSAPHLCAQVPIGGCMMVSICCNTGFMTSLLVFVVASSGAVA